MNATPHCKKKMLGLMLNGGNIIPGPGYEFQQNWPFAGKQGKKNSDWSRLMYLLPKIDGCYCTRRTQSNLSPISQSLHFYILDFLTVPKKLQDLNRAQDHWNYKVCSYISYFYVWPSFPSLQVPFLPNFFASTKIGCSLHFKDFS